MARKGREFEKLIQRIERAINPKETKVESPGYLKDIDTDKDREVDVLISYLDMPHPFLIAVECRDRQGNEDVTWIEQLIEKRNSVTVDKVIAVSSKGFSLGAIKKAKSHNIQTLNLSKLPPDVEQVILSKVMKIQHLNVEAEKILILLNDQHADLLKRLRVEMKGKGLNEVMLYKNDKSLWGTVGQLISRQVPKDVYDALEEGQKATKGLVLNFTNPQDCLFVKVGKKYARIDKIKALVNCYWVQQEAVFDTTYLSDASNSAHVLAKHAEATFSYRNKKVTFSLTKRGDLTFAQVEISKL